MGDNLSTEAGTWLNVSNDDPSSVCLNPGDGKEAVGHASTRTGSGSGVFCQGRWTASPRECGEGGWDSDTRGPGRRQKRPWNVLWLRYGRSRRGQRPSPAPLGPGAGRRAAGGAAAPAGGAFRSRAQRGSWAWAGTGRGVPRTRGDVWGPRDDVTHGPRGEI